MNVVVGYVPTREGESALDHALEETRNRGGRLIVVNTSRGDALVDERYADEGHLDALRDRLAATGFEHELVHTMRGRGPPRRSSPSPMSAERISSSSDCVGARRSASCSSGRRPSGYCSRRPAPCWP